MPEGSKQVILEILIENKRFINTCLVFLQQYPTLPMNISYLASVIPGSSSNRLFVARIATEITYFSPF